jgi:hypothetical protein
LAAFLKALSTSKRHQNHLEKVRSDEPQRQSSLSKVIETAWRRHGPFRRRNLETVVKVARLEKALRMAKKTTSRRPSSKGPLPRSVVERRPVEDGVETMHDGGSEDGRLFKTARLDHAL